ncbi:MAG: AAA family ATPase, partial [Mycobacterium sp.]
MWWPLIGRSDEIHRIEAALTAPGVPGVVVRGAAGLGKSRVIREVLDAAASTGHRTHFVSATSSARAIPLGALAGWTPPGATDAAQLVRGVIEALTSTTSGTAVVLGVDDAHLLDDLSAFVIHQIVAKGAAKVLFTVLDGQPIPAAVQEIWKAGYDHHELAPLSRDDTALLLSAVLGAPVDPVAGQRLWDLTRGNVLYLRNIVEQEVADNRLTLQEGRWRWAGDPIVPPTLVELIESRFGELPPEVSEVVDVLAVGEPIDLAVLQRITDPAAVEEADTRGLITLETVGGTVRVRVGHPLYAQVRRRRAPPTRLRRLRGSIAAELAQGADRDEIQVVVRRAALSLDSDLPADVDLLTRAAHGAVWLADLALADRLAQVAIAAGGGPEPSFVRAHALSWLGRGEEAEAVLTGIPLDNLTEEERARLTFLRASNVLWVLADPDRAKWVVDAAAPGASPTARSYLDAFRTVYWFAIDEPMTAQQAAQDLALTELPAVVGAEVAWALSVIAGDSGSTGEAVALAEAGYTVAARSRDAPHMTFNIADAHLSALILAGRVTEALELAERVRAEAAQLPGAAGLLGDAIAGRAALGAGRLDTAMPLLARATDGLSVSHATGWGYRYQIPRLTAAAMGGDDSDVVGLLAVHENHPRAFRSLDYEQSLARAWVVAGQGAVSAAVAGVRSAAERAAATGRFGAEVVCLQTAVQFGDTTCVGRISELENLVEGPRAGLAARFALALRRGDAAGLSSVSEEFEQLGDLVAALDAAAHAAVA